MIELLNRIWRTLSSTYQAIVANTTTILNHDKTLARIESKLDTLTLRCTSLEATLLNIDATLDGMVDTLHDVRDGVTKILAAVTPLPVAKILFTFDLEGQISTGDYMKITVTQKFAAAIAPVDKFNNPALIDGKPLWEAADPTIVSLVPSVDGLSVDVKALGKIGTSQVSCTVDADLGAGTINIVETFQVDVIAGQAVSLGIVIGEAVEQDVPTTA